MRELSEKTLMALSEKTLEDEFFKYVENYLEKSHPNYLEYFKNTILTSRKKENLQGLVGNYVVHQLLNWLFIIEDRVKFMEFYEEIGEIEYKIEYK